MHVSQPVKNERELKNSIAVDPFPNCKATEMMWCHFFHIIKLGLGMG